MGIALEVTTVNVINQGNRVLRREDRWKEFKFSILNAMDWLVHTRMQYEYIISPLLKLDGVGEIKEKLDQALSIHGETINSLDKAIDDKDTDKIVQLLITYEETAFQMAEYFSELHKASLRHPVHSTIPVVNDILAVAMDIFNGLLPDDPLNLRITNLVNYSRFLEKQEKDFEKNFPDEKNVSELYSNAVKVTVDALSKIEIYLETGDKGELKKGIDFLAKLDEMMNKCRTAAEHKSMSRIEGYYRPAVQNVFWIIEEKKKAKATKEDLLNGISVLEKMHDLEAGELLLTETFVFLKPEIREKYLNSLRDILTRQKQTIESMKENLDTNEKLISLLEDFDDLLDDFSDTGEEMLEDMTMKVNLSKLPAAEYLLNTIKHVYQGEIPDHHLIKSLTSLRDSVEEITKIMKDIPEDDLKKILETQNSGIELINKYLIETDRKLLPEAYSKIEESSLKIHGILLPAEIPENVEMEKV